VCTCAQASNEGIVGSFGTTPGVRALGLAEPFSIEKALDQGRLSGHIETAFILAP
jgi:hypothetical protein